MDTVACSLMVIYSITELDTHLSYHKTITIRK